MDTSKSSPEVRRSSRREIPAEQLQEVASLFAVLSEPTRLRILQRLKHAPAHVTQLVDDLDLKQANVSKQLALLHTAGIVERQREGSTVTYRIAMPLVFDLCELVCGGLRERFRDKARQWR